MKVATPEAYQLFHAGSQCLAQIEANGIAIDTDYLKRVTAQTTRKIKRLETELKEDRIYKLWKRETGDKFTFGSRQQLAKVLFQRLKYPCKMLTATGKPKMDAEALQGVDLPFVKNYLQVEKLKKLRGTYLEGVRKEVVDGRIHPVFNLHTVSSFRSSSSDPNFQNIPIRDVEIAKIIRPCFVPDENEYFVEVDFKGAEVCVSCCYNLDPVLIKYITDPTSDMHLDVSAQCFMLDNSQVSKKCRYVGKNQFTFPQFYGSYFTDCARGMWDSIDRYKLERTDGVGLKQHLKENGITRLGPCDPNSKPLSGTFERHIKEVEEDFWGNRFKVYAAWKDKWYKRYLREGGFSTLTGFRIEGQLSRNQVLNLPVQGSSFHCLLWTLIEAQKQIVLRKMKAKLIGQIHDSAFATVPKREIQDYLNMITHLVSVELPKTWKWIIVPLTVECEISDSHWHAKKPWHCKNGIWSEAA